MTIRVSYRYIRNTMPCKANVLLVMIIMCRLPNRCAALRANYTRRPLLGYRCVLGDQTRQTTLLNTARAQCVWRCLSSNDCKVVSFNHRLNNCELSDQLCVTVASAADFSINVYGIQRTLCSHWVPKSDFDEQKAVVFPQIAGNVPNLAVARKMVGEGLYPGKHQRFNAFPIITVVEENIIVSDGRGEVLLVDSACLLIWVPYTSPNILPIGSYAAGYDINGENLFVARAKIGGTYSIGYYKSSKLLAYFMINGEVRAATAMDILVLL